MDTMHKMYAIFSMSVSGRVWVCICVYLCVSVWPLCGDRCNSNCISTIQAARMAVKYFGFTCQLMHCIVAAVLGFCVMSKHRETH